MAGKRFAYCSSAEAVYRQWSEQTVCKRDMPEVYRRRLEIEQAAEDFLKSGGELTQERQHAINLARFEIARSEWRFDETLACQIVARVYETEPEFVPDDTAAAPSRYRMTLRLLGFANTERLARFLRGPAAPAEPRVAWR
jgi:hypothetical protein